MFAVQLQHRNVLRRPIDSILGSICSLPWVWYALAIRALYTKRTCVQLALITRRVTRYVQPLACSETETLMLHWVIGHWSRRDGRLDWGWDCGQQYRRLLETVRHSSAPPRFAHTGYGILLLMCCTPNTGVERLPNVVLEDTNVGSIGRLSSIAKNCTDSVFDSRSSSCFDIQNTCMYQRGCAFGGYFGPASCGPP